MDKKYGLLGKGLKHSFSPKIHSFFGDYEYLLYNKYEDEFEGFIKKKEYDGLNITMPYKKKAMLLCDEVSRKAEKSGNVNTIIKLSNGSLYGDNTDYDGFLFLLQRNNINLNNKKVIILGDGAVSHTIQAVLEDNFDARFFAISRRGNDNYQNLSKHYDAEVIINATPVGMYPNNGEKIIDIYRFTKCSNVIDVIYNPLKTKLLLEAENLKIPTTNGLLMLIYQAKVAAELFTRRDIPDECVFKILKKIIREQMNIAFIGMPGVGKTTIGQNIAKMFNWEFIDTDSLICEVTGKNTEDIFRNEGEGKFREYETRVLSEVSKRNNLVIATGGGVVVNKENKDILRQNSIVIFLDRNILSLDIGKRPLSIKMGLDKIRNERFALYENWCDYKINCDNMDLAIDEIKNTILNVTT